MQQRCVHVLDGGHHARIRRIGVLQRQQMRHLVVDVDAGGCVHLVLQRVENNVLAIRELLAPQSAALPCMLSELLREAQQRALERRVAVPTPVCGE